MESLSVPLPAPVSAVVAKVITFEWAQPRLYAAALVLAGVILICSGTLPAAREPKRRPAVRVPA